MKMEDQKYLRSEIAKGKDVSELIAKLVPTAGISADVVLYIDKAKPGFVSACQGEIDPHTGACKNWLYDIPDPLGHLAAKLLLS